MQRRGLTAGLPKLLEVTGLLERWWLAVDTVGELSVAAGGLGPNFRLLWYAAM